MSIWTHVVGAIRIDAMAFRCRPSVKDIEKILGSALIKGQGEKPRLPLGSEGSLAYSIHVYNKEANMPWAVLTVWGDLRDYDNTQEIRKWWRTTLCDLNTRNAYAPLYTVRDAILRVWVEGKRPHVWHK
jgi:hypothetical protein